MRIEKYTNITSAILLSLLPLSYFIGIFFVETLIFLLIFLFIYTVYKKKISWLHFSELKYLSIIYLYLIFNYIISEYEFELTNLRSIFFIRFILLAIAISFFLKNNKFFSYIINVWFFCLIFICFDVWVEFLRGYNIFNFHSTDTTRIASLFKNELISGTWIYSFTFVILFYLKNKNSMFFIFLISFILLSIFITGERSIFVKTLIIIFILSSFFYKKIYKFKKIQISFIVIIAGLLFIYKTSNNLGVRYNGQFFEPIKKNGIINFYKNSLHGAHSITGLNIFLNNPLFGVGLKNFRKECQKSEYFNIDYAKTIERCSTHPHQIAVEILSELGLFGFILIYLIIARIIFEHLKIFFKELNLIHGWSIFYIIIFLFPLLPSGSFFSNFNASLFWINFGIMLSFKKKLY